MDPASASAAVSKAIRDEADAILARLALRKEYVTPDQIKGALTLQATMRESGEPASLGRVLCELGLLTEKQLKMLEHVTQKALNKLQSESISEPAPEPEKIDPTRDVHFGRAKIDQFRTRLAPSKFKTMLVETFLEAALASRLSGPPTEPFGPFKRLEMLGQGGMAVVYKVHDEELSEDVALKVMLPELATKDEYVRRFIREASNTALLDHNNIVRLYGMGSVRGRLYFTLELIEGKTLKERMNEGRIPPKASLEILRQVLDGLITAHEQGIGHRDLKPSNIMLTTNKNQFGFDIQGESNTVVKIMDFGLARDLAGEAVGKITQEGQFLGTAKYVAPELIRGAEPTLQSDIFSIGVMAFQMFSGEPPFRVRSKVDYIEANLTRHPPLIHEIAPEIAPGYSWLVDAMLAKDPLKRPTADALLRDIGRLENLGVEDSPYEDDDVSSVFFGDPEARATARRAPPKRPRPAVLQSLDFEDPRVVAGLVVGLVVLGMLFFWMLSGGRSSPPDIPPPGGSSGGAPGAPDTPDKPKPLSTLDGFDDILPPPSGSISSLVDRRDYATAIKEGDAAFRRSRYQEAVNSWRTANSLFPTGALGPRITAGRRKISVAAMRKAEDNQDWATLRQLADEAISEDYADESIRAWRRKAEKNLGAVRQLESQLRAVRELIAGRRFSEARTKLEEARKPALALGRLEEWTGLDSELLRARSGGTTGGSSGSGSGGSAGDSAGGSSGGSGGSTAGSSTGGGAKPDKDELDKAYAQVEDAIRTQSWTSAKRALDIARKRGLAKDRVEFLEKAIRFGETAPRGFVFVPPGAVKIFGMAKPVGPLFVVREPVSNSQYKDYLDRAGTASRPPESWRGGYPRSFPDAPVERVKRRDAKSYAKTAGGRLPDRIERERIKNWLRLRVKTINRTNADDEFEDGFYVLREVPGYK